MWFYGFYPEKLKVINDSLARLSALELKMKKNQVTQQTKNQIYGLLTNIKGFYIKVFPFQLTISYECLQSVRFHHSSFYGQIYLIEILQNLYSMVRRQVLIAIILFVLTVQAANQPAAVRNRGKNTF